MYTIITHTAFGYSVHTLASEAAATELFNGMCTTSANGQLVMAIFFYGPDGEINNWLRERA